MRTSRLFLDLPLNAGEHIELDDESAHYLRNVLRLKKASHVIVFNGTGGEWQARVLEAHKKKVLLAIADWQEKNVESPLKVHMAMGVSRSERMDWALQKTVELGAVELSPLVMERCVVQLNEQKVQHKHRHWQGIIRNATEQCGRTCLPKLNQAIQLNDWLPVQTGTRIFLDPLASQDLKQLTPEGQRVTLLSGPEGGFSEQERQYLQQAGFIPVKLGKRILRTETAALTALAAAQVLWGDLCA